MPVETAVGCKKKGVVLSVARVVIERDGANASPCRRVYEAQDAPCCRIPGAGTGSAVRARRYRQRAAASRASPRAGYIHGGIPLEPYPAVSGFVPDIIRSEKQIAPTCRWIERFHCCVFGGCICKGIA